MKTINKKAVVFLLLLIFTVLGMTSVSARDTENMQSGSDGLVPNEYSQVIDNLPDEVAGRVPDGVYSSDVEALGDAVAEMSSAEYMLTYLAELFSLGIGDAAKLLCSVVGEYQSFIRKGVKYGTEQLY